MERKTAQNFILTLSQEEYAPFLFSLSQSSLPVELDGKWKSGSQSIKLSLCLPLEFDPSVLTEMWFKWKDEDMDLDYTPLN